MEITQIRIPELWKTFIVKNSPLLEKLSPISNWDQPSFFYSTLTIDEVLTKHRSIAVIIVNNMTRPLEDRLSQIKEREKSICFISTSKLASNRLDSLGLKYIEFPFWTMPITPNPIQKGKDIYFYAPTNQNWFYGYSRINKILDKHFPHIRLIGPQNRLRHHPTSLYPTYAREDLYKYIYPRCFLYIRLTPFDGLANTVQELGLCGIKTVWNGGTPSALSYQTDEDIIEHIRIEEKLIGTTDTQLATQVSQFLNPHNPQYSHVFQLETYLNLQLKPPKIFQ